MGKSLIIYNKIRDFLFEGVESDVVDDAINNRYHVRITYDDGQNDTEGKKKKRAVSGNPKGSRVIQVYANGTTMRDEPVIRAFQVSANSRRGAPGWKHFILDRITSWRPMRNKRFHSPPDGKYGKYNPEGDRLMKTVTNYVKFPFMTQGDAELLNMKDAPKISTKNVEGPVMVNQQRKKNVFTSQPNSEKYKAAARNIEREQPKSADFWAEYDKAMQQSNQTQKGPINNDELDYDVNDTEYDENEFFKNTNKK